MAYLLVNFCYSTASTVPVHSKNYLHLIPWHVSDAQFTVGCYLVWYVSTDACIWSGGECSSVGGGERSRAPPRLPGQNPHLTGRLSQFSPKLCMKFRNKKFPFAEATYKFPQFIIFAYFPQFCGSRTESGSICQRYGSGSFYHLAKIVKNIDSYCFVTSLCLFIFDK
jgi:hypothetical protein